MSGLSGGIDITQDRVLTSLEKLTNAKVNEATTFTARLKAGSVTSRELAAAFSTTYFDTVAALRANAETISDGTRVLATGYHTAGANDAGPEFTVDTADTSTADDGLSCLVDANGLRYKRTFATAINMKWSGYRAAADGTETYAGANDTAWAAVKAYLDVNPNTVVIPGDGALVYYYSADQEAAADCTYVLDGTIKKKANVNAVGFDVPNGADNVTLTGSGTIHGNATVTQVRAGGEAIRATVNNNFSILGRIKIYHTEGHAVNIRQATNLTIDGMYVRNTYGSVKSGNSVSGINMDGIHLYNPSQAVVRNCDIQSIDDSMAITMLEAYTNETGGVMVSNCILQPVAALNGAASGDGSEQVVVGAGFRITQEGSETLCRLRDVTISDCYVTGGVAGMYVGATGLTGSTKFVERIQINNMHFVDIATAADMSINRALAAGIFMRAVKDAVVSDCTFSNCGVMAIRVGSVENVEFNNLLAVGGTVDNANYPVNDEFERAHYLVTGSHSASNGVYLRNVRSIDADGAGIAVVFNGGAGKELSNVVVQGTVDNPNQHGGTNIQHSAVYLLNLTGSEIVDYAVDVVNFTPSGNVIEMGRGSSLITKQKVQPLNIKAWHTDTYLAAGNWFTRLQPFSPTYTVENHYEGYTFVVKCVGGSTNLTGTAQAGGPTSITLAAGVAEPTGCFVGLTINLTGGTGGGQNNVISAYDFTTKVATVENTWATDPDGTTTYEIVEDGGDGLYSAPLAGGSLNDVHTVIEFSIYVDSGSVNIVEDSSMHVVKEVITDTGVWLNVTKYLAPDQTSTRIGWVAAETGTVFYLGPVRVYEL